MAALASARSALAASLAWALALLVSALFALAASLAMDLWPAESSPTFGILVTWLFILLILLLFVGLWRVFRAVRPVRPYRSRAGWASFLEGVFQVQGLVVALTVGGAVGAWLEREVEGRLLSTPIETLAAPAGLLSALSMWLVLFLVLRRVPHQLLVLRLKGVVSAPTAGEIIVLIIGIGQLGIIFGLMDVLPAYLNDYTNFLGITTAAILGYTLSRLWLTRPGSNTAPCLWLVLTHPSTFPGWPKLVDRISPGRRAGPMALVSPPDAVPHGEHLYLADRLGMLDSLFPRLEIEVRDWQRTLPPADRWSGVVHRQVHPPVALMPILLDSYLGPLDQVLLIASCEDDVQIWRGRLPVDRTRVLWVATQDEEQVGARPDRVAGYPVIVMDAKTSGRINMQGWFSSQDKQATTNEEREAPFEIRDNKNWKQKIAPWAVVAILALGAGVYWARVEVPRVPISMTQQFAQPLVETAGLRFKALEVKSARFQGYVVEAAPRGLLVAANQRPAPGTTLFRGGTVEVEFIRREPYRLVCKGGGPLGAVVPGDDLRFEMHPGTWSLDMKPGSCTWVTGPIHPNQDPVLRPVGFKDQLPELFNEAPGHMLTFCAYSEYDQPNASRSERLVALNYQQFLTPDDNGKLNPTVAGHVCDDRL